MTAYRYRAIALGGSVVTGTLDAADEASVLNHLRALGHYPVSASVAGKNRFAALLSMFTSARRVSYRRLSLATQELSTLIAAGLDLDRALAVLERLGDLGPLQKSFAGVRARVHEGASFADALSDEHTFPAFFVSAIRAGELGGSLERTLQRLSEYLASAVAVRESVASALVYPIILIITAGLSVVFILMFVLPEFVPLFREAGRTLPWPTRVIVAIGDFLRSFWWLVALTAAATTVSLQQLFQKPYYAALRDRTLLRLPVLGPLLTAIDVERFSRTLGTLLANGVPLPSALPLAREVVSNKIMAAAVSDSAQGLREGDALADRLGRAGVFPAVTLDLIRVGEETGKLDEMLLKQADLDEQRIRHSVNRLLAILVPALTMLLGAVVAGLIASLLTAILSVNDLALPQ
jgi:general secretion pathway protein F